MQKTQLRTGPLGSTGLEITRVGFGTWALGGGGDRGWGWQDRPAQVDPVLAAASLELSGEDLAEIDAVSRR